MADDPEHATRSQGAEARPARWHNWSPICLMTEVALGLWSLVHGRDGNGKGGGPPREDARALLKAVQEDSEVRSNIADLPKLNLTPSSYQAAREDAYYCLRPSIDRPGPPMVVHDVWHRILEENALRW